MRFTRRNLSVALTASALTLTAFACGSRTGLIADGVWNPEGDDDEDGSTDPIRRLDARVMDVQEPLPTLDARPDVVVDQRDCTDPSETLIYTISSANILYAFDPRTFVFRAIGPILCPSNGGSTPFSMAVDRQGAAYIVFNDGELFRVSTKTAACVATPFQAGQQGVNTFGMGFASDQGGPAETLFIASTEFANSGQNGAEAALGSIDIPGFGLDLVGPFVPRIFGAELTGTGDGRLFAFYNKDGANESSFIGQVDRATAEVVAESELPTVQQGSGWAFAFWGGDFFTFTQPGGNTIVQRFRPSDGSIVEVGSVADTIVGAGVSTCSPVE